MAEPELAVQHAFVKWFNQEKSYMEHLSDPNGGSKALMDSIGTIGGRAFLLEFKHKLGLAGVRYSPEKTTSVERKICKTIERLYSGQLLPGWSADHLPAVYVVATAIRPEAMAPLRAMLDQRAVDWCFTYSFGEWGTLGYRVLGEGPVAHPPASKIKTVRLPEMPAAKQDRQSPRAMAEFAAAAKANIVGDLFELFMKLAQVNGCSYQCNLENVLLKTRSRVSGKWLNSIGLWPIHSSRNGLLVTFRADRLAECFPVHCSALDSTKWRTGPAKGYLGRGVFLADQAEVKAFWDLIVQETRQ